MLSYIENTLTFLSNLFSYNNIPNLLSNLGIALLTVFIPFAIAIFTDILQKKDNSEISFSKLDLHVILDFVFSFKKVLCAVFLIFVPSMFWQSSDDLWKLIIMEIWLLGIFILVRSLMNIYSWTKGKTLDFRLNYLKKLRNEATEEIVWRSVWEAINMNPASERKFFSIFSERIDEIFESEKNINKLNHAFKLLADFSLFLNKRSLFFLIVDREVFPKFLGWHYGVWKKEKELLKKEKKIMLWSSYSELGRILDEVLNKIEERSLSDRNRLASSDLFEHIKNQLKSIKNEKYLGDFFEMFYGTFFDVISRNELMSIDWDFFPDNWKVTLKKIKAGELMPRLTLNAYIRLFLDKINNKQDMDYKLDDITVNLFPEIDPISWSRILLFIFSGYDPNNRIKSLVNRFWSVGNLGRCRTYSFSSDLEVNEHIINDSKIERENTFALAVLLFKDRLSKDIKKYIREAKELKFDKSSKEEDKRIGILNILIEIEKIIEP
jgi:hypothetical protein